MSSSASRRLRRAGRPLVSGRSRETDFSPLSFDPERFNPKNPRQLEEAVAACRLAIRLRPGWAEAHTTLADALLFQGELDEAIAAYGRALALQPTLIEPRRLMAGALMHRGRTAEAIAAYRRVMELQPDHAEAHNNFLWLMHYHPDYDAPALLAEHRRWAHRFAEPLAGEIRAHPNDRSPDRPLRVGFVGRCFGEGMQGLCLLALFLGRDPARHEYICFSETPQPDPLTRKLKGLVDGWREIVGLTDPQVAALIRADRIDILVDLEMHTPGNRMLVFARKPAPVQVTALEMLTTTGLGTMDYRLTDSYIDPPGETDDHYSERSIRLPHCFWCYHPPEGTPPIAESPAMRRGFVTFGCFNNALKMNRPTRELWARVLQALPASRMIIHAPSVLHEEQTYAVLKDAGVARDRIDFVPFHPRPQYFACHHDFDICLDTQPYAGGTSTLDALWMGVPVVTLAGRTGVGRGGVSILSNLGLPELIARTPEQYVEIAVALAGDRARLAELRSGLRQRMQASPLMDGKQYAADVDAAFRQMWRTWCGSRRS